MNKPRIPIRIPPGFLAEINQCVEKTGTSNTDVMVSEIATCLGCVDTVPLSQKITKVDSHFQRTALTAFDLT